MTPDHRRSPLNWIERHPKSVLYLLAVTTLNLLLSILDTAHVL